MPDIKLVTSSTSTCADQCGIKIGGGGGGGGGEKKEKGRGGGGGGGGGNCVIQHD